MISFHNFYDLFQKKKLGNWARLSSKELGLGENEFMYLLEKGTQTDYIP